MLRIALAFPLSLAFITSAFAANQAPGQIPGQIPGMGKHKSNAPIEINADKLEVLQQENKAIFTGHVVAVQADVHIKSEKMTVFYKSAQNGEKKPEAPKAAPTQQSSIEKILVENNVFLSTPEETASGNSGIYDLEKSKIFLNGDVVLTRGQNVLKGDRLVYDFSTGRSSLNAGGSEANGKKQRVKGLFIPGGSDK